MTGDGSFDRPSLDPLTVTREDPVPGDAVKIIAGRHRGASGTLAGISDVGTPSGSTVRIAFVNRPRAGETPVFSHEIERA